MRDVHPSFLVPSIVVRSSFVRRRRRRAYNKQHVEHDVELLPGPWEEETRRVA